MSDPFEALRTPLAPADPDPAFAATLRARLARRLSPGGITVTALDFFAEPAAVTTEPPIVPYLIVTDAPRALDWYVHALGAHRRGEPTIMPNGRVGHAEFELNGGFIYLADEAPQIGVVAPRPDEGSTVSIMALVRDVDEVTESAVANGARLERPPADYPYGRNAVIRDPFGHRWILSAPPPATFAMQSAGPGIHEGDISYVSLWVPDVQRAAAFFGRALGWSFARGASAQGRQVERVTPSHGLWGGQERSNLFLCYAVDDVGAAAARVRTAGGQADEATDEPYGRVANCIDNQGTAFALHQPRRDAGFTRPSLNGQRQGDLSYVTIEVRDSAAARAFYSAVLGWRFSPGRVADGWQVEDVHPMTGLRGGRQTDTVVPMYRVDDINDAVERVQAAGGTATAPEQQPYGISSECTDDQGTRFHLGQL
jgi:predicted enzyme related to lactoylglutathione lyase